MECNVRNLVDDFTSEPPLPPSPLPPSPLTPHSSQVYEVVQALSRAMPHVTSTTDLPARFPDLPSDQRGHVIHELYTTEYTYVTGLEVVSEVFKDTLTPILLDETSSIFANVDE